MKSRIVLVACGALAFAASAGADEGGVLIGIGDSFAVKGTATVCTAVRLSDGDAIQCLKTLHGSPVTGGLGFSIYASGRVRLFRFRATDPMTIVERHSTIPGPDVPSQSTTPRRLTVVPNSPQSDVLLSGSSVICVVFKLTTGPKLTRGVQVECTYHTTQVVPGSYGAGVSDAYASMFSFDSQGARHTVKLLAQPA